MTNFTSQKDILLESLHQQLKDGVATKLLLSQLCDFMDMQIQTIWDMYLTSDAPNITLIATGGYGRRELYPYSDIDILILINETLSNEEVDQIEKFLLKLWDEKITISHSVRTLKQCKIGAQENIKTMTSFLQGRLLIGNENAFSEFNQIIRSTCVWPNASFVEAKIDELNARHQRFEDTPTALEPNLKESPGSLRDIHTMEWVCNRCFDSNDLYELVTHNILLSSEYDKLCLQLDYLQRIRFILHLIGKRKLDRILFDYQPELVPYFKSDLIIDAKSLMREYYEITQSIYALTLTFLQLVTEKFILEPVTEEFNEHYQLRNGYLTVTDNRVFEKHPAIFLELFLLPLQSPRIKGIHAHTLRLLYQYRAHLNEDYPNKFKHLFIELLKHPKNIAPTLRKMSRYFVLPNYIPSFQHAIGLMQYDLFHQYTVGQHIIRTVSFIYEFREASAKITFPFAEKISASIDKPELLVIAALFHDLGKGQQGEHATIAAAKARDFCQQHDLSYEDTDLVEWLVQEHLLFSLTAQKKDIYDPSVISEFAKRIGNSKHLAYLYLLTVADINATNTKLWNGWKETLFKELYEFTLQTLTSPIEELFANEQSVKTHLQSKNINSDFISQLLDNLPDDYFHIHSKEIINEHFSLIASHNTDNPLIEIINRGQISELFIFCKDQEYLFATATTILKQFNLNIFEAKISTTQNGYTLDSFYIQTMNYEPITIVYDIKQIKKRLTNFITNKTIPKKTNFRRQATYLRNIETNILFTQNQDSTMLEVTTHDRIGILAELGLLFVKHRLSVVRAKITTYGENVDDIFILKNEKSQCLSIEEQTLLKNDILEMLEKNICQTV